MTAWAIGCGLGTTAALLLLLRLYRQGRNVLPEDCPRPGRKRHGRPTPMAGAIPCAATALCFGFADRPALVAAILLAGLTGFGDDLRKSRHDGLGWKTKAVGLLGASLLIATNFLDNMHGVATAVAGTGLVLLAAGGLPVATPLAAIWLAFLPFNWPHGRAFLGDAGAYGLGAALAAATLLSSGDQPLLALAPTAVLLLDFVQVVGARLYLGYAPWIGDRRHLSHLLLGLGVPHALVAVTLAAAAAVFGLAIPALAHGG
jgi:UDP-N-acetylmuramyl pentapeptide phosphotransferase/UDP-N-acetylglucosamine-1-phosphate transferase